MCGIYAAVGSSAQQKVFDGIKRIEYRGYDSWGVAGLMTAESAKRGSHDQKSDKKHGRKSDQKKAEISLFKRVGKIGAAGKVNLETAKVAIGHTRWATHGGVTETNAHPHLASDGSFALAQNGVVENYQELKTQLMKAGYKFKTQTDTEIIVGLLEQEAKKKGGKISVEVVRRAMKKLAGRSTIVIIAIDGRLYGYRQGSPLVVGRNKKGEYFFSSDVASMSVDAPEYFAVENGELVELAEGKVKVYDLNERKNNQKNNQSAMVPKFITVSVRAMSLDKAGFPHFMSKEIQEQTSVYTAVVKQPQKWLEQLVRALKRAPHVYLLGAGSASFAGNQISFWLRQQGLSATSVYAYEAASYISLLQKNDVWIVISQSGETADTNEVVEWLRAQSTKMRAPITIASIVNMAGSTLTRLSDLPFMLQAGPEVGVASTKAFTGQLIWGWLVAQLVGGKTMSSLQKAVNAYEKKLAAWLSNVKVTKQLKILALDFSRHQHLFILGRGQLYASAMEFALKLKEVSYIHAEGFSGGELKHGVIALIENGTPIVCLVAEDGEKTAMLNAAAEVKARGGRIIGVAIENNELFDDWIVLPDAPAFAPISSVIPAQLLTYFLALHKGLDPDKPRNLAKSVTVK